MFGKKNKERYLYEIFCPLKSSLASFYHGNEFIWNNDTTKVFLERRGNLKKITLFAMIELWENDLILTKDWKNIAKTSNIIQNTYEVTNVADGKYIDILNQLSKMLNFKFSLFKRFDENWGSIDENGNWNGMISNLMSGEADIVGASLTMCCRRTEVIDYLWAINHPVEVFAIKGYTIFSKYNTLNDKDQKFSNDHDI